MQLINFKLYSWSKLFEGYVFASVLHNYAKRSMQVLRP